MDVAEKTPNNADKYYCESCRVTCSKKSDWSRHILTRKHFRITEDNRLKTSKGVDLNDHMCRCGNVYKYMSGLCKHKKRCVYKEPEEPEESDFDDLSEESYSRPSNITTDIVMEIIKQNQELKNLLMEERNEFKNLFVEQNSKIIELSKQNMVVTNNNQFNLNVFLNEKCKDAISLDDFIESLQIDTQTAEYAGKHGFVNGVTNIFMTGLRQLDIYMRPIHCTDMKREIMYVKGADIWSKDNEQNAKILAAIKCVSKRNVRQLQAWIEENPDSCIIGTDKYEEQIKIMSGLLDIGTNKEKVLKNLIREVLIDKYVK
jgi:hypothetical protein